MVNKNVTKWKTPTFYVATFCVQTVAEMEGITHGIRAEGSKRVTIQAKEEKEEAKPITAKMKLRSKYAHDIPLQETKTPKKTQDKKGERSLLFFYSL